MAVLIIFAPSLSGTATAADRVLKAVKVTWVFSNPVYQQWQTFDKDTVVVTAFYTNGIESGYVLGGTKLISDSAVKSIFSMGSGDTVIVK